ncbi:hypothetical protein [Tautonia sociabilis]|uniref:Uncharacterized protein n=1 Tax=Tautonia sociabilis TaxID=2080755 RepID=A0A432MMV7_9BACT|nr:hypothetical protein [Tautonia sociabilis]RUL88630.1 hypothetical protein TsocGM_05685 [Tautonia sociabilis]
MTRPYNRFHGPEEHSPEVLKLRELHSKMDTAVLEAIGWHDLAASAAYELLLDSEEDEEPTGRRRRRKPWRSRWPDDVRDEVLARLLELNRWRAEQERMGGAAAGGRGKRAPR